MDIVEGCFHDEKRGGLFCTWVRCWLIDPNRDRDGREEKAMPGMDLDDFLLVL